MSALERIMKSGDCLPVRLALSNTQKSALRGLGLDSDLMTKREIVAELATTKNGRVRSLLGSSSKTDLGVGLGYNTRILYMSPWSEAGVQSCPFSSEGCRSSCLISSGRMVIDQARNSRMRKRLFHEVGAGLFWDLLYGEIKRHELESMIKGLQPVVRLNGTTDLNPRAMVHFDDHKRVQFMDYTKRPVRSADVYGLLDVPNYHLTFSLDERKVSRMRADQWLDRGQGVAVVVGHAGNDSSKGAKKIARAIVERGHLWGLPVVDGDAHDLRFLDPAGAHYVILSAKGKALRDRSGFVHRFYGGE